MTTTFLADSFGRKLNYLRISLTDRCQFRCIYCMPPEGVPLLPREDILSLEEIQRLAKIFVSLGVKKIRLTGGEPLLRKKIVSLVAHLAFIKGLEHLGLTTNGAKLASLAQPLKEAGLASVNVSLDSLNYLRFQRVTRQNQLHEVLEGINQAFRVSLQVKINVVALNDLKKEEVIAFCNLTRHLPIEVRFLELMPLCGTAWNQDLGLSMFLLKKWVTQKLPLKKMPRDDQVAETFQVEGYRGRIGFIASLSEPFCDSCNRLRLTSTGTLRPCLFSNQEIDLRMPLRNGASDEEIANLICQGAWAKPKGHKEILENMKAEELPKIRMVGG